MNRPFRNVRCVVCGGEGARMNYQAMTCEKCRVFFYRFISKPQYYPRCANDCPLIDTRRTCKPCRYRKCIAAGMRANEVGSRRNGGRSTDRLEETEILENMMTYHGMLVNYGTKAANNLRLAESAQEFAQIMANFELFIVSGSGKNIITIDTNINLSISDLIRSPANCTTREAAVFYPVCYDSTVPSLAYRKAYCRIVTAFADYLGMIEEFHELDEPDKIILLRSNLMIYTLFEALYRYFNLKKNNLVPYSKIPYTAKNAPDDHWNKRQEHFQHQTGMTIASFIEMDITLEEYLLLRIIAMFHSAHYYSVAGYKTVNRAREKYIAIMAELIKARFSHEKALQRISKILRIIRFAEDYIQFGKERHANMVINNYDDMKGILTWDIHINGSIYQHRASAID